MLTNDIRGLQLTGIDNEGVAQYEQVIQAIYEYKPGIGDHLQPIIDRYPEFIMGRVVMAYSAASEGRFTVLHNVATMSKPLQVLYENATKREKSHIDAVSSWVSGDLTKAIEIWDTILAKWPHDLVAFRQMTMNLFWMGQRRRLADLCARLLPFWNESTPQYSFFIGPVGFVMEEIGQYKLAETYARRAVELNPADLWAVHAVAHVLEMQGRSKEGIEWIESKSHKFNEHNAFVGHLWWHLALFYLENNNIDKVLSLFDQHIYPGDSDFYLDIQNGASLLSRLSFLGVDVANRWNMLLSAAQTNKGDYVYEFTEIHNAIILARNGKNTDLEALNYQLSNRLNSSKHNTWLTYQITQAISDFHSDNTSMAATRLAPIRYEQTSLGGSHAQQDLLLQYQIMAYQQSGDIIMMKAALKERLAKRSIGNDIEGFLVNAKDIDALKVNDSIAPFLMKI